MADLYKQQPRKKKGYSFYDGKLNLGNEENVYGPQNDPNATPVEKAGLINPKREQKAEKAWNEEQKAQQQQGPQNKPTMDEETGEIKLNGANQNQQPNEIKIGEFVPTKWKKGDAASEESKELQNQLIEGGYLPKGSADGKWGTGSQAALNNYYRDNGIVPPVAKQLDQTFADIGIQPKSYAPGGNKEGQGTKLTIDGKPVDYQTSEVSSGGEVDPSLVRFAETDLKGIVDTIGGENMRVIGGNDLYHLSDKYYDNRFKSYFNKPQTDKKGNITKKGQRRLNLIKKTLPNWDGKSPLTVEQRNKLKKVPALGWKSNHTDGKSMDFTVTPAGVGKTSWKKNPKYVERVNKVLDWMTSNGYEKIGLGKYKNKETGDIILDEYNYPSASASGPHFHTGANDGYHAPKKEK